MRSITSEADEWFALRAVSIAARGLWADIVHLLRHSAELDREMVCRMVGITAAEFDSLAQELKGACVMWCDEAGRIRSERLERDSKKRALQRENGKKGGNPILLASRQS